MTLSKGSYLKPRREREALRIVRKIPDRLTLGKRMMEGEEIEETELHSGFRERVAEGPGEYFVRGKMGYPGAEVARFLGVTTSSINRLAVSGEVANLTKYLNLF